MVTPSGNVQAQIIRKQHIQDTAKASSLKNANAVLSRTWDYASAVGSAYLYLLDVSP